MKDMYIFSLIKWNYQVANSEAQIYSIPHEKGSRNPDDNLRNDDVKAAEQTKVSHREEKLLGSLTSVKMDIFSHLISLSN